MWDRYHVQSCPRIPRDYKVTRCHDKSQALVLRRIHAGEVERIDWAALSGDSGNLRIRAERPCHVDNVSVQMKRQDLRRSYTALHPFLERAVLLMMWLVPQRNGNARRFVTTETDQPAPGDLAMRDGFRARRAAAIQQRISCMRHQYGELSGLRPSPKALST
jgi:hypothetical protein